jgi:hypothetical protein
MLTPLEDPDVWWLLRGGRYIVETGTFPRVDPFSASAQGATWVNHAWGFEVLLYAVHAVGGTTALIGLGAVFAMLTFGVLYAVMRREGLGTAWALGLVALGALATRGFWYPRPQLVTYLFLALFWSVLRGSAAGPSGRLGWLPVLTVLWVNLHGGFLVGPALVAVVLAADGLAWLLAPAGEAAPPVRRLRALAGVLAASLAAALVNPFHYHAILFPLQVLGDAFSQAHIAEWGPLPFQHPQVMLLEGLVILTLGLFAAGPAIASWRDVAVLLPFLHLGLTAIRNTPLLVIVLLPVAGRALGERWRTVGPRLAAASRWRWPVAATAVALSGVLALIGLARGVPPALAAFMPRLGESSDAFPAGAVEFLRRHPEPGALFNEYVWGGYLIWHLFPDYRVTIDGRAAVYGPRRFREHVAIVDLHPGWREALARQPASLAVIRTGSPLAVVLRGDGDWQMLYEDAVATVLRRTGKAE